MSARNGFPTGWVVFGLVGLAFGGWFAVRVRDATQTQSALAAERTQAAKSAEAQPPAGERVKQRIVTGVPESWRPTVTLEGTLQPVREADLGFKAAGRLGSIRVRLGERVRAGDVLAALEDTEARAQVQAAEAQVRAAEAQLNLADDTDKRIGSLAGKGAASEMSGVQTGQQKLLASAQVDGAKAQLALAQANLKNHALVAPFAGAVTRVPSGPGAIVNPGVALFHLSDTSTLKLAATVTEADAGLVKPGAQVELAVDGRVVRGKVAVVLSSVDAATRRVPVEATIVNPTDAPLLGGSFVRAQVVGIEEVAVLRLPANTLRPGSQNELMVVKNSRLERRRVTFSTGTGSGVLLVRAGLSPSEQVLVAPTPEAQDGDPVALQQ